MSDIKEGNHYTGLEIAVIGMAGRFPGARNIEEFWDNLKNGVEAITFFTDEELEQAGVGRELLDNPDYVKAMGVLEDIDAFDAAFFDYTPGEAEVLDPQVRVFHECAWEALEQAGYVPDNYDGLMGLYAGASDSFFWKGMAVLAGKMETFGQFGLDHLANKDYLCSRIAYKLDLKGPVVSVQTACSTSLVAIHMACQGLLSGETDIALAGGVSIIPFKGGYLYQEGMIQSPDGHCRAFDISAGGTLAGCGAGVVVLKRLEEAVEDGDFIHALIKGSAMNNDGQQKMGYTAPSVEGQFEVVRDALRTAQVEVESIGCLEAHGTGTALGDPVEVEALKLAFETTNKAFCGIGSVKTNIGHLDTAAGAAGFIKTVLALKHHLMPPSLNFEIPNKDIDFINSPFYVNTGLTQWQSHGNHPLRAGVSSLGIGGTNVHMVVEEWPGSPSSTAWSREQGAGSEERRDYQLILLSAKTSSALDEMKENLANYFKNNPVNPVNPLNPVLPHIAYTLKVGRKAFDHRWMAVCGSVEEAVQALTSPGAGEYQLVLPGEENTLAVDLAGENKESLLDIGKAWLYGRDIDWNAFYGEEKRCRVPLPTYPFERQRYWLEEPTDRQFTIDVFDGKRQDLSDWFYLPSWKRTGTPALKPDILPAGTCWLVFMDGCGLGSRLKERLEHQEQVVITVEAGQAFRQENDWQFIINPPEGGHYDTLFDQLKAASRVPGQILHLWGVTGGEQVENDQDKGFYSLLHTAQAIGKKGINDETPITITVVTDHMQSVTGEDGVCPGKAAVLGPVKVIPVEYANIQCRSIDVVMQQPGSWQEKRLIQRLFEETIAGSPDPVVAFRGQHRWVQTFEPLRLETPGEPFTRLRQGGVYWITGGTGGIGFLLAQSLAKQVRAKLILTGRTALPAGEKKVKALEELGSDFLTAAADVCDLEQMQAVIDRAKERFGCIHGVIHLAGLPDGEMIHHRTRETSERIFAAKINGTLVLDSLLKDMELDFFVLGSSINAIVPIFGQVGYCGANAFLDAFAHQRMSRERGGCLTVSVNWQRWQSVGIAAIAEAYHQQLTGENLGGGLKPEQGVESFYRILESGQALPQVVVSTRDVGELLEQSRTFTVSSLMERVGETTARGAGRVYKRPELKTQYTAPANEIEQRLANTWATFFRFEKVGVHDDFFHLGGDSLKVITLVAIIQKEFDVKVSIEEFFNRPTVRKLAAYLEQLGKGDVYMSIEPVEKKEYYPLSSAQKRLYLLQQMDVTTTVYNIPFISPLEKESKSDKIEFALKKLVVRHESLRTSFHMIDEVPMQKIHCPEDVSFAVVFEAAGGLAPLSSQDIEQTVGSFVKPFDLSAPPLLRASIVKRQDGSQFLMVDMHHIVSDGISQAILIEDFMALYNGAVLESLPLQYKDFSQWQNCLFDSGAIKTQEDYWLDLYCSPEAGEIPVLQMPADFKRPEVFTFAGDNYDFRVEKEDVARFRELGKGSSRTPTLYMSILAILNILFYKYAGQTDIIIGSVTAGRRHHDIQRIIGMFANTLPMRNYPDGEKTYKVFLKEVMAASLRAFENQDVPFEELVDKLDLERDPSRNPLFDICMLVQNLPQAGQVESNFSFALYKNPASRFDMTFIIHETGDGLYINIEYYTGLFRKESIQRLAGHFKHIIKAVINNPTVRLKDIEMISENEKKQVLYEFNDTARPYPKDKTIHELFEVQAAKTPDRIAVVGPGRFSNRIHRTYRTMNEAADQLAHLLQKKGARPDTIIGLMADRSIEMIIGILGILKAGGAYLPIDPDYPRERIDFMLKDSGIRIILTDLSEGHRFNCQLSIVNCQLSMSSPKSPLHHSSFITHHSSNLAYVIYTSGTTGRPKGTLTCHANVIRVVKNTNYIDITEQDRLLQLSNYAFDGSVFDIYGALLNGAALVMIKAGDILSVDTLSEVITKEVITVFFVTTALFNVLVDVKINSFDRVRKVLFGGEKVSVEHTKKALEYLGKDRVIHVYGPTETTVYATYYPVNSAAAIPIGRPISNTTVYILDRDLNPMPILACGEVYIGGDGVARGYLNSPELTNQKFCGGPGGGFSKEPPGRRRHYITGDLARWLPDGNIEFIGRIDQQVKIRGFRIELEEIELFLLKHESVREAVVVARGEESGERYLCAYIVPGGAPQQSAGDGVELKQYLSQLLPDYMIPAYFLCIDKIPLTPNGKVDRKALPSPEVTAAEVYTAPRNEIERTLVGIWAEVLGVKKPIGINDNFFQLGGHSLRAAVLTSKIHKELRVKVPLVEVFRRQTLASMADYIKHAKAIDYAGIEPVEKKEYYELSSAQKRLYFLQQMDLSSTSYNIPLALPLGKDIQKEKLEITLKKLIARHESLRTSFIKIDELPFQKIHEPDEMAFEIEYYESDKVNNFIRPFDLSQAPLMRSGLFRQPDGHFTWVVDIHHIVSDGTSHTILAEDFLSLYRGEALAPPTLRIQYKDFSQWQNRLFESGQTRSQEDYWLSLYSGDIPRLELLTDHKRPEVFTFAGDRYHFILEREHVLKFKALAARNEGTLYMNLLAALNTLFHKYTGQTDIIIGTGIAGRPHADLQHIIGMFVNTLAVRNDPEGEKTYESFLKEVVDNSFKAFENQDLQFEELVDRLELQRDPSRNPLFDISLVVQNFRPIGEGYVEGLPLLEQDPSTGFYKNLTSKVDITFFAWEQGDDVHFDVEYYTGIFRETTIRRMVSHFKNIIRTVIREPSVKLKDIEIINEEEKRQVLGVFNDTAEDFPVYQTISQWFAAQVEKTSARVAIECKSEQVTYRELDRQANRVAGYLAHQKGITIDDRVGIWMDRGIYMAVAILGILKAGGAYVPIDPSLLEIRKKQMINDIDIGVVLSEKKYIRDLNRLQWACESFHSYLCMDSRDVYREEEVEEKGLMDRELWEHVGETAVDEITGGGWLSSYTGEPLSRAEMDEYGDNILKKLEPLLHPGMRVLEIGCASGISMYRIAPGAALYYGTDLSRVIIAKNKKRVKEEGYTNIKLAPLAAHEIDQLEEKNFDIVIINSVIQAFHGHNYLRKVIGKCIDLMGERGYLFAGDIMDLEKKGAMIRELEAFKRDNADKGVNTKTDFTAELFLSRDFWKDLAVEIGEIEDVRFSDKIHTIKNELTTFRYDTMLTINKTLPASVKKQRKQKLQEDLNALLNCGDEALHLELPSDSLCYIIFTSGTTGVPRPAAVENQALLNYIHWRIRTHSYSPQDVTLQLLSYSFDGFASNFYSSLLSGGKLVVVPSENLLDYDYINRLIKERDVTNTSLVPAMYDALLNHSQEGDLWSLRFVVLGGEKASGHLVEKSRRQNPGVVLINEYGPTEAAVAASANVKMDRVGTTVIGRPISNVCIVILDPAHHLQPVGAAGELCISGIGLARGYLNTPELTNSKFQRGWPPLSFSASQLLSFSLYRSGDLARWLPDGNIELLGRMDQQVKIRGFRIEPGEIESYLLKHDLIREAVVIDRATESGETYLCGYVVCEETFDLSELTDFLSRRLPEYMIPAHLIEIENVPLTANGKVDRKALPVPAVAAAEGYAAPRDQIEKVLVDIWWEILNVDKELIGINNNFFQLGGHSLKATILTSRIRKNLEVKVPLAEVFKNQTVRELAEYIRKARESKYDSIQPVEKKEYYELSSAQKRLYFLQQMDLNSTSYNMPLVLSPGKDVDKDKIEVTLKKLIARHESLRTSFIKMNELPVQKIHEPDEVIFEIEYYDLTGIVRDFIRPFDLSQVPLMRSGLFRQPEGYFTWVVDIHHIVSDGTSHTILSEDFLALYRGETLEPLRLHYKDFSQWQNHLFKSGEIKDQEQYWLDLYSGDIPRLTMPADHKRPEVFTFAGDNYCFVLERDDALKFKALGADVGGTLYMNMLAVLNTLVYKYTGQTDIIIGTGIAGRPHADLQQIIGMFINTLAMRNYPDGEKTYESFLKEVIAHSVEAFENQDVQFEELVERLDPERDPSRNPLFDISIVVQNFRRIGEGMPAVPGEDRSGRVQELPLPDKDLPSPDAVYKNTTSKFDMTFFIYELDEDVHIDIEYYTGIFEEETIRRMASHFANVIKAVNAAPFIKLKDIDIIPEEEKHLVLNTFNQTDHEYPCDKTIHQLFEDQVEKIPDRIALIGRHTVVTYGELNKKADQLACYLCHERGIQPEHRVGIWMSRPLELAVSMLGVLKSGAAYVPIEPSLPLERIKYMVNDASINMIISEKRYIRNLNRLQWECDSFDNYLCMDSYNIHAEEEVEQSELMNSELWHHVGEIAADDITGGGWLSSYTGEPFSREEMDEYGNNILEKLEPLLHPEMRVLEIGCASGISMYRIAPKVGLYYGTDLSAIIIEKNKKRLEEEGIGNIKLACAAAHEIHQINEKNFDLIIMNSVIQCFHGHNYLRKVIRQSINVLGEKGYLFIGDIMDQEKKDALVLEMTAFKNANNDKNNYKTKTDFSAELFVARRFFRDLETEWTDIETVEFSEKIYTIENELTKFRYDTLITINKNKQSSPRKTVRKRKYQDDLGKLSAFEGEVFRSSVSPHQLAYIIYTSGTTGRPKGVKMEHRGVVNTLWYRKEAYGMNPSFVALQLFSYSFDGFVAGFFTPLISGSRIVMLDREELGDIDKIRDAVVRHGVTHFISVPPLYSAMLESFSKEAFFSLKAVTLAGDRVDLKLLQRTRDKSHNLEIVNEYGVTESAVMSTIFRHQERESRIKIGHPIWNTKVYILNEARQMQPVGAAGELCISGSGLARGYLNNPELTNSKFQIPNYKAPAGPPLRFSASQLLSFSFYRTGDLARWLSDGNIEFLGRIDLQVKIRGFRIELGEIEARLSEHRMVRESVVIDRVVEDGERHLCAYIVPVSAAGFDNSELKDHLTAVLPDYMIPSYFISIDQIPLTPSGKVNRRLLPEPGIKIGEEYAAPRDDTERKLAEIWSEVLNIDKDKIGIDANFFQLGGHSLKATILTSKIHKALNVKIPLAEIFKIQTIRGLSDIIKKSAKETFVEIRPVPVKDHYELSFNQKRLWIMQQTNPDSNFFNMMGHIVIKEPVDKTLIKQTVGALIKMHESLRTGFKEVSGKVVQYIIDTYDIHFDAVDISPVQESKKQSRLREIIDEFNKAPFRLDKPPLFKSLLVSIAPELHILVYNMHHIVSDGWSMEIIERDFHRIYRAYRENPGYSFEAMDRECDQVTYKDFAHWHNRQLENAPGKEISREFWIRFLKEELPVLQLPGASTGRENTREKKGAGYRFVIPGNMKDALKDLSKIHNITLFSLMYSTYIIFLSNISGQPVVVSSIVNAGRDHPSLHHIVGFFVNAVLFKKAINRDAIFIDFAGEVQASVLEFFKHQNYPLELVLDEVGRKYPEVGASFNMLNTGNNETVPLENPEPAHELETQNVKFDIEPFVSEYSNGIEVNVSYNRSLFKAEHIEYMMEKYRKLIEFFAFNPFKKLKDHKEEKKRRSFKKDRRVQ